MNRKIRRIFLFLSLSLLVVVNMRVIISQSCFVIANVASFFGDHNTASSFFMALNKYPEMSAIDKEKVALNQANEFYQLKQYQNSVMPYFSLSGSKNEDIAFESNHNLGNTWYRLGEKQTDLQQKIFLYTQSLLSYKKALAIRGLDITKKNYDFVAAKLAEAQKQLKQQQEKKKQEQKDREDNKKKESESKGKDGNQQDKQQDNSKKDDNAKGGENSGAKKMEGQTWVNTGHFQPVAKGAGGQKPLSEDQKSQVEGYLQYLQEAQKNQGSYVNPDGKPMEGGLFGDIFGANPFFSSPENEGDKPDW